VKAMANLIDSISADRGGLEALSTIERILIHRCAFAELHASKEEQNAAEGKPFDLARWCVMTDRVMRLGQLIGLERRARELPTLAEQLRDEEQQQP